MNLNLNNNLLYRNKNNLFNNNKLNHLNNNLFMDEITSWDNYSDVSSEGDEDIYRSTSNTETGKQYMMKKYMNNVKDAISVKYLS